VDDVGGVEKKRRVGGGLAVDHREAQERKIKGTKRAVKLGGVLVVEYRSKTTVVKLSGFKKKRTASIIRRHWDWTAGQRELHWGKKNINGI